MKLLARLDLWRNTACYLGVVAVVLLAIQVTGAIR